MRTICLGSRDDDSCLRKITWFSKHGEDVLGTSGDINLKKKHGTDFFLYKIWWNYLLIGILWLPFSTISSADVRFGLDASDSHPTHSFSLSDMYLLLVFDSIVLSSFSILVIWFLFYSSWSSSLTLVVMYSVKINLTTKTNPTGNTNSLDQDREILESRQFSDLDLK
jgi:hypothetical protein